MVYKGLYNLLIKCLKKALILTIFLKYRNLYKNQIVLTKHGYHTR